MPNLRIIARNHADVATLAASSAALPTSNLQTPCRTQVWRSVGTTATLTATWAVAVGVDSVAIMTSNFSSADTWRIRAYDAVNALLYDSGTVLACPPRPLGDLNFGFEPLGVNAFSFGMAAQSVLWMPARVAATKLEIDLDGTYNPSGYMEASRLVIGARWEPVTNLSWGCQLAFEDRGKQWRSEDGTLRSEAGPKLRSLKFSLDWMNEADRAKFAEFTRWAGLKADFVVCAYPTDGSDRESHYTLLGKLVRAPGIVGQKYGIYASQVDIEEV